MNIHFRTLRADEIEVRPATVKDGKTTLLLYIDSRAAARILNETVGVTNWQMTYKEVNGQTFGQLSIWDDEKQQWITKEDTGSESNIEAQKGQASDCLKRCLVRYGVDELYSSPRITLNGTYQGALSVSEIEYNENREITHLVICQWEKEIYRWDRGLKSSYTASFSDNDNTTSTNSIALLTQFCTAKKSTENKASLKKFYDFYKKLMDDGKFKSNFNADERWNKWKASDRSSNYVLSVAGPDEGDAVNIMG